MEEPVQDLKVRLRAYALRIIRMHCSSFIVHHSSFGAQ